jgi:hypothetical protein
MEVKIIVFTAFIYESVLERLDLYSKFITLHSSIVVKALCYKPEGRRFDTRWGDFLNLPNPSSRTRPWDLLILQQKWIPET